MVRFVGPSRRSPGPSSSASATICSSAARRCSFVRALVVDKVLQPDEAVAAGVLHGNLAALADADQRGPRGTEAVRSLQVVNMASNVGDGDALAARQGFGDMPQGLVHMACGSSSRSPLAAPNAGRFAGLPSPASLRTRTHWAMTAP